VWVLIAEDRDGYPRRLPAVKHLHKAGDERPALPEVHNATRAARKAYRHAGTMPDLAALA